MQSIFLFKLEALGTLDRRTHHLSYQGGSKSPPHIFFVLTNLTWSNLLVAHTCTTLSWLICIFQVSPVNEPYQTLVSLRQSILCGYDNFTFFFFGGGVICRIVVFVKLLTGLWSSCKRFRTWSQCCHFGWSLRCLDT